MKMSAPPAMQPITIPTFRPTFEEEDLVSSELELNAVALVEEDVREVDGLVSVGVDCNGISVVCGGGVDVVCGDGVYVVCGGGVYVVCEGGVYVVDGGGGYVVGGGGGGSYVV